MPTCIRNVNIVTENQVITNGSLVFEKGIITGIFNHPNPIDNETDVIDGSELWAVPGYIDVHCHGGNNYDCNDATQEAIETVAAYHKQHGITSFYPTLSTDSLPIIIQGFEAVRQAMANNAAGRSEILGIHLEGPFLNIRFKGSQAGDYFIPMEKHHLDIIRNYKDIIKRITIAPEVGDHLQFIPLLAGMGIIVSGGHSTCTYAQAENAVRHGMSSVTHLFNAMSQVQKSGPYRICGLTEAALNIDSLYAEIIADTHHVPVPMIQIAYKCKKADKLIICSDANKASGHIERGTFNIYGETYIIENGIALNYTRTSLAGSVTSLDSMVKNLVNKAGIPFIDVIKMASTTPARLMGIDNRKGSIEKGKDADINLLDNEFNVVRSFCKGI